MVYWLLKYVLLGPLLRLVYRPKAMGLANVPAQGPVILAANHLSFIDSFFIPLLVPRRVVYLGKADYFDSWKTRWFMKIANVIPVRREGGSASEAAINAGIEALRQGHVVGIYPEGTRSPDGRLYRGKTGVARMALESGAAVVPVAVRGTDEIMPIGARFPKTIPGRVRVRFGRPLSFERFADRPRDRFVLRSVSDEILYEIMMMTGQEYVDEYAARVKKELAEEEARARTVVLPDREPAPTG
jgi:1-acyl-sn-glycerol-3-phosphate acyltransferase